MSEWDYQRNIKGELIGNAGETIAAILKNHGKDCDTYKTAMEYKKTSSQELTEDEREDLEHEFLNSILEDYRIMMDKEFEYQTSRENVEENIRINEYEFTVDGKRLRI